MTDQWYVQDSRAYVGNSILWHAKGKSGYTTNPEEAHIFTGEEAFALHASRSTDKPWPKKYIDSKKTYHVDAQNVDDNVTK